MSVRLIFDGMFFTRVQAGNVAYGQINKQKNKFKKKKKKSKKKSECTCHWKACSAFSGCFCSSFIHSVCTIYAFLGVHWFKRICYKKNGVIKGYIILCMVHYLLLIMATF